MIARLLNNTGNIHCCEIDFNSLINAYHPLPVFKPLKPYALIKLDLNINLNSKINYRTIKTLAFNQSKYLQQIELIDIYKNRVTIRFYFNSPEKNLTETEAKAKLNKIANSIKGQR